MRRRIVVRGVGEKGREFLCREIKKKREKRYTVTPIHKLPSLN